MAEHSKGASPNQKIEKPMVRLESVQEEVQRSLEGSLDTIKEILVGEHAKDIQKKLTLLEERLSRDLSNTQELASRKTDALEGFVRKELSLIREEIKLEQQERISGVDRCTGEFRELTRGLDHRLIQSFQSMSTHLGQIRDQMLDESHRLNEEFARTLRVVHEEIDQIFNELEARKPDRDLLATLFMKMAGALQTRPQLRPMSKTDDKGEKKSA